MGRNRQAQRTKNNARPSNSSRSAELLGSSIPNFVGFSAVKDGGYVPILPGLSICNVNEIEMNNVDPNFQIVLKKMNKKDATTKCKALQEFATMCKESDLPAVEGMLPFWPRLYCALAVDVEHRVREAAQFAHAVLVKRVGKSIALYLKQLAGTWFTSQYDTYPPAASAAINSFNDTFPNKKFVEAIIFCQHEILIYICNNITVHTAQSLSEQKSLTAEELESKYQKVLIASLQGYSSYLKEVPAIEIQKMVDIHSKIISNNRFWKLVKHDALPIKTAFFNVLTSIIEHADILLKTEKKRAVTAIMNSLDESEPGLLAAVWESMLIAISKIEDWYSVVSIEKLVLPKLWRVLQSGGQCCASIVYPNLLPFLSQFPHFNVDINQLYINFFSNMRHGFSAKSVLLSRSEMHAVATSFIECLRYAILLNIANENLCNTLLKEQLIPVLKTCLKENSPMKNILFCEAAHLVRYWSKNRDKYANLMNAFWKELNLLFDTCITESQNSETLGTVDTNNSQIELLLTLKTAPTHTKKNLKLRFSSPEDNTTIKPQVKHLESETDVLFITELNNFVDSVCIIYFKKIMEEKAKKCIVYLNKLLTSFEDKECSVILSNMMKKEVNFFNLYNTTLQSWLIQDTEETEHIIQLIFNFLKYMNDEEKNQILKSLTEFDDITVTRCVIQCSLLKSHRNDLIVKKWCSQSKVTNLVIDVAKAIASGNYADLEKNQSLILLAFETFDDGEPLIEEEGINQIVSTLCNSLHQVDETHLLYFSKLISCIVPLTWTQKELTLGAVQVLVTLFELCTQDYFNNHAVFTDTMRDVLKKGLLEVLLKLSHSEFIDLTKNLSNILWKKVYNSIEEHEKQTLVDIAVDFLEVIIGDDASIGADYAKEIILTFIMESNIKTWMVKTTGLILYGEVITGELYISTLDQKIKIHQDLTPIDLVNCDTEDETANCLMWAFFTTNLLNNLYMRSKNFSEAQEPDSEWIAQNDLLLPGITDIVMNVIYSIILGELYGCYYKSTKWYHNVNKQLLLVQQSFTLLQAHFDKNLDNNIIDYIQTNHSCYNSMTLHIINFYCNKMRPNEQHEELLRNYINSEFTDNENKLQTIQVLNKYARQENILSSMDDDVAALIIARSMLSKQQDKLSYTTILEKVMSYEKENPLLLLHNCDVRDTPWEKMIMPLEVMRLLTQLIKTVPEKLTNDQWNFTLISLVLWQLSINKSKQNGTDLKIGAMIIAVCQLYHALQSFLYKHEQEKIEGLPPNLLDEWKNVFATDVQNGIVETWMFYVVKTLRKTFTTTSVWECLKCMDQPPDSYSEKPAILRPVIVLDHLGKAISVLDTNLISRNESNTFDVKNTIKMSHKLLQCPVTSIQLGAYYVLKYITSELVTRDKVLIENENFDQNALHIKQMEGVLQDTQNYVNTMLMDFKLCDTVSCTIQPYTESYKYTLGYLLAWAIIMEMCAKAQGDLRYQYAEILKSDFFPCLLNNIFRLMPVEVLQDNKNKCAKLEELFSAVPSLDFGESWTEWRLDHIVCWLYTNSLKHLPGLVKQWWNTADSRVSAAVDKITTYYVSPMLIQEELLSNRVTNIENMQIKVHATARKVIALYQMDDAKLELSIILSVNYPLGPVTVEPGRYVGGTVNWKICHMQLSIFLANQNGSVWDKLALWKRSLDKKFAGVEECYICFSIFHISTYQIPKLSCRTCRKKFHTPCLYKWFNTSHKSTCPICRNVF